MLILYFCFMIFKRTDAYPYRFFLYLLFFLFFAGCKHGSSALTGRHQKKISEPKIFAIIHVNVITMTVGNDVLSNATVIIDDGKIVSLNGPVPDSAVIIDGKGKWIMPGLIDMHVHIPVDGHFNATMPTRTASIFTNTQDIMTPFVANGVTTILELISKAGHFGQRNEILRGDVIGPRMALAAMINGGNGSGRIANTASDGRQSVRMAKAEGYGFIKVYSQLDTETFKAIVDEAHKQGMKVVGHIPDAFKGKTEDAFVPHFGMVAHADEFVRQTEEFTELEAKRFAQMAKKNGTWVTPTLTCMAWIADQARTLDNVRALPSLPYVHPLLQSKWLTANGYNKNKTPERIAYEEKVVESNIMMVKALKEAGVPIVAGTDAGTSGVVWGFSLHDELELLVKAGLTNEEALASATRLPAIWLGIDKEVGTVETGKSADLILLDSNPLENIKNTRKISGVFFNGRWRDKTTIDIMLSDLSKRNNASKQQWDWSKRSEF
jgi:imidazolonepropionase-like amidohydrolase